MVCAETVTARPIPVTVSIALKRDEWPEAVSAAGLR
jgi:hypothetical protein